MKSAFGLFVLAVLMAMASVSCTKKSTDAVEGKISGVVNVSPELASKLKDTDVLYIIVRSQQVGPPTAVKRFVNPKFPLQYVVGPEDSMMPGANGFASGDPLTVAARISRTGNAMPAAGDLEGIFKENPVKPGKGGVDITIDRERQ